MPPNTCVWPPRSYLIFSVKKNIFDLFLDSWYVAQSFDRPFNKIVPKHFDPFLDPLYTFLAKFWGNRHDLA